MEDRKGLVPWADGTYICQSAQTAFIHVKGENCVMEAPIVGNNEETAKGTWKFGEFGEANQDVAEKTGKTKNDVHIIMYNGLMEMKGIVSEDGRKITFWSPYANVLDEYTWLSEEEEAAIRDSRDPCDAPPSHYKIQPEYQGKFIFVSGGPGLGKSTTGHLLSKIAGFVYYEADCFLRGTNPYLPPDAKNPSIDALKLKPLKDIPHDRLEIVGKGAKHFFALIEGNDYDLNHVENLYTAMCKDIVKERKRMGGDWVVAQAVPTRALRDMMKKELGPDVLFIVLNMSKEDQEIRVKMRHGGDAKRFHELLLKGHAVFEPAADDEERAINVLVSNEMTRQEVAEKVLHVIQ